MKRRNSYHTVPSLFYEVIIDIDAFNLGFMTLSSVRASFFLPFICFVVVAIFGFRTFAVHHPPSEEKYAKA